MAFSSYDSPSWNSDLDLAIVSQLLSQARNQRVARAKREELLVSIRPYSRAASCECPSGSPEKSLRLISRCSSCLLLFVWVGKLSLFWSGSLLRSLRMDSFVSWSALLSHCNRLAGPPSRWSFTHELVSGGEEESINFFLIRPPIYHDRLLSFLSIIVLG